MSSAPATDAKLDSTNESDDFDAATDLCDFGFVLAPPLTPSPEKHPDPIVLARP